MDYGLEAAGFETVAAVEYEEDCCSTLRTNRDWPVIEKDIHEVESEEILGTAGLDSGDVDLLAGGPPCQPFSKSAYWKTGDTERLDDWRANTLTEFMRCVRDLRPQVFLLENVHGISYSGKEEGFQLLKEFTKRINDQEGTNYSLSWEVLDTADYGVPQSRTRFFLVGHRGGQSFGFPEPTHTEVDGSGRKQDKIGEETLKPYATAWDAIGDLSAPPDENLSLNGKWADLVPSIPEGENYQWHSPRKDGADIFEWRSRYWNFLLKLGKDRPSWTIQAQPGPAVGPLHWENRYLSVREMARLQTFPDDVEFVGSRRSVQRQLGNAVPSLMAEVIGRRIAEQFLDRTYDGQPELRVPLDRPIPDPEPLEPVPEKYIGMGNLEEQTPDGVEVLAPSP